MVAPESNQTGAGKMNLLALAVAAIGTGVAFKLWTRHAAMQREAFIRNAELPKGLFAKVKEKYPHLTQKDCELVAHGLRQFFLAHLKSGRKFVAMPSQAVDELWHEFILHTKSYDLFCKRAFGQFLHHTPAVVLTSNRQKNTGLRRCWWFACKEENINPRSAARLPLLFALDGKLNIANGFRYVPDCKGVRRDSAGGDSGAAYCGAEFSSHSYDGGTDGFADGSGSDGGGSDSGGGSDGCGGGGCGGGGD
jgi:hypothetical protein